MKSCKPYSFVRLASTVLSLCFLHLRRSLESWLPLFFLLGCDGEETHELVSCESPYTRHWFLGCRFRLPSKGILYVKTWLFGQLKRIWIFGRFALYEDWNLWRTDLCWSALVNAAWCTWSNRTRTLQEVMWAGYSFHLIGRINFPTFPVIYSC